jgi:hypothetical protein
MEDLRDLLQDLLGRSIESSRSDQPLPEAGAVVADYVTDEGVVGAVVVCDLPFAVRCAAAITLVPSPAADESIEEGEFPQHLSDNLREVLNVAASLLNSAETPHLTIRKVYGPAEARPPDVLRLLSSSPDHRAFDADIQGYGPGRFAVTVS